LRDANRFFVRVLDALPRPRASRADVSAVLPDVHVVHRLYDPLMCTAEYLDDLTHALEVDLDFPPDVKAIQFDVIVEFHEEGKAECLPPLPVLLPRQFEEGLGQAVQVIRDCLETTGYKPVEDGEGGLES
jgi:hypothetical protein